MKPLLSIITVSFNSAKTIERTIKSVLNQTNQKFEYIIIDGSSTDGTLDIITKYEPLFGGRMKWISESDDGIYDAMNKGISRAYGDIIGIVNSDDWLESDALATIANAFEKNDCDLFSIYCGWMNFCYSNGKVQILKTSEKLLKKKSASYIMAGIRHPAVFVPKMIYDKYGTFDSRMKILADTDLILRYFNKGINFNFVEKVVTNMSDGGVSNKKQIASTKDYILILRKHKVPFYRQKILIFKYFTRMLIKSMVPSFLIEQYRKLN